jgi:hypothetical protein
MTPKGSAVPACFLPVHVPVPVPESSELRIARRVKNAAVVRLEDMMTRRRIHALKRRIGNGNGNVHGNGKNFDL